MTARAPVLYLPHGGGPMPLTDDPTHAELRAFLQQVPERFPTPRAVLLISAHWEAPRASVYDDPAPELLFDYYGFPPPTYHYRYPAPGEPALADRVQALLTDAGIEAATVQGRGFDHGMFVPMMLLWPQANVPCVQLSLIRGLDPQAHLALGRALGALRDDGVAIVGSGMSFHNLKAIFAGAVPQQVEASDAFDGWLVETVTMALSPEEQRARLADWDTAAPHARFCHPREEHLLPLHVCAGAAGFANAELIFNRPLMGHRVSGFGWF
ncbi:MAG TPA: class III extradiol ring-cleavage dioxygenase [Hyphomicrobiales bacterium]|nr:class III extradiol ring-cleavage dioxygenase [Hyphomicrobiales bacterium]